MTYLQLSAVFLAVASIGGVLVALLSRNRPNAAALSLTALILVALTAVFDTVMIATGLFHYSAAHLLGVHIGLAPLEDFAYPIAGVLLLPALWTALRSRRPRRSPESAVEDDAV